MYTELFRKLSKIAWFLPGFLLWAAFPPMGERMDALFALAPLMWLSRREVSAWISAKRWFQSGLFFWVATLYWMPAIVKNGGPWPLVVLGWFALAAYCALYFGAYGWLSAKFWNYARDFAAERAQRGRRGGHGLRLLGILIVEPVLWCGLELVRSRLMGGFAWNQLGVVPVNSGFGAPAALGGVYLCSAVVILINGTIAGIAERVWKPAQSGFANLKRMGSVETLLAFGIVWGIYAASNGRFVAARTESAPYQDGNRTIEQSEQSNSRYLKVALVQRNFPCVFKAQEENAVEVYGELLENVAPLRPDLVVLPESAMCEFSPVDQQGAVRFAEWVAKKTGGAALLAGGTRYEEGLTYNSAALYGGAKDNKRTTTSEVCGLQSAGEGGSRAETSVEIYDKVHLVPFGEFIPGDKLFPALQKFAPVGSCTAGDPTLLYHPMGPTPFGVAICFEDTDSALMRRYAAMGARFLCFITNDSWFSHSIESEQHAWQAVARAIETGLPVVRVGNSGVTGTITPAGKTSWLIGPNGRPLVDRQGTMFDRLGIAGGELPTPYVLLGDVPLGIIFALLILGMILVKYRHYYEKRRFVSL